MDLRDAEAEIKRLKDEIEVLRTENEVQKVNLSQYEEDFKHEREDRIRATEARDRVEKEFKAYKEAHAVPSKQHNTKTGQKTALKEENERLKKENSEIKQQLAGVKVNLEAMEQLIQLQTKRLTAELEAAKEEIAVKVAQVKQYQKQVEAYKQQPHILEEAMQPFGRGQSFTEPVCVQSKMNQSELNSGSDTSKSGSVASFPECCEPDGGSDEDDDSDDDLPPPIYHVPIEYQHGTNGVQGSTPFSQLGLPLGSDGVAHTNGNPPMPSPHLMQNIATADGIDGGTSCIRAGIRRDAIGSRRLRETYSPAPLDPNLKCPVCGICFKKGRIQRFKQHVQTCKVHA